jgi:signal transduction histidine kinase/PAS domain-containing protein
VTKSRVSLPAGTSSRVLAIAVSVALAAAVWGGRRLLQWTGDDSQFAILAGAGLLAGVLSSAAFFRRWRTLTERADAWTAAAAGMIALHFAVTLTAAWLVAAPEVAGRVEHVSWIVSQLAALTALAFAAEDAFTRGDRFRLRHLAAVIAGGASLGVLMVVAARLTPFVIKRPEQLAFSVAFLVVAAEHLRNPRQRWREAYLATGVMVFAVAHLVLAWSEVRLDESFMWANVLLPLGLAIPMVGAARDDQDRLRSLTTLSDRVKGQRRHTGVLLDTLPVLVLSVDRTHRLHYANRIASDLLGIPHGVTDPNLGASWLARIHGPDRKRLHGAIPTVAEGSSGGWEAVLRAVGGDGGIHWLNTQLHPVNDPESGDTLVEVVASDVTDLFLARRTSETRQTRMTFLSNVAQTVAGEVADQRILERFLELGQEIYPMVSLLLYRPMPDGGRLRLESVKGPGVEAFEGDRHFPVGSGHPCGLTYRDGFPRTATTQDTLPQEVAADLAAAHGITHLLYLPLLAAGRVVGVLATTTTSEPALASEEIDLLTQVGFLLGGAIYLSQLVRELDEQRAMAMEASRLKSEFLANTSHELRTPLTAILGFLRLVIDGAVADPEKQKEFLGIAHESAGKLLTIINDVLDLAKIEAGRLEIHHEPVPARRILNDVEALFRHQMKSQGLTFRVSPPEGNSVLWADSDRTVQILTNLLSNAIKFTPRGGEIAVGCRSSSGAITFTVRDTGSGIPTEELTRVFDSFYQMDGSTTRRHGGTGLGLTISLRLAELMDGALALDSPGAGQGTIARLTLKEYTESTFSEPFD